MEQSRRNYAEQLVQLRNGRGVEEMLRELYLERRYTDEEIGSLFGVQRTTIQNWRRKYGIRPSDRAPVRL